MIKRKQSQDIAADYRGLTVGVLGSHSALEVMDGAKDEDLRTLVVCQKGRETPYKRFSRLADKTIVLDKFKDMASSKMQNHLRESNTIIVPHRALTAYLGYDTIESKFLVPIFGNRSLFRAEERYEKRNQYYLLEKARIRHPKLFKNPRDISGPCIVKVQEKKRRLERAFFNVSSYDEFKTKSEDRIKKGMISQDELDRASIEEFCIGTYFNFNYFYTPISEEVDFLGIERRLQTNIHDLNSLPARQQLEIDDSIALQNIEVGHMPASIRESFLEQVIKLGDKFVRAVKREYPPGIIGPFSLQSVITRDLEIIVYDVSLRVPGNPILATTTPYTKYKYGETFGVGRRIAMELKKALEEDSLREIVT